MLEKIQLQPWSLNVKFLFKNYFIVYIILRCDLYIIQYKNNIYKNNIEYMRQLKTVEHPSCFDLTKMGMEGGTTTQSGYHSYEILYLSVHMNCIWNYFSLLDKSMQIR